MKATNKTIVITGAAAGMGKEISLQLLKRGARVAAIDLKQQSLDELKTAAGDLAKNLSVHVCDITDRAAVEKLPEEIIKTHGAIDGIINNAGIIQPFVRINDLEYSAIEHVMQVNFYGLVYMTKTFLPYLLKRPEAHIVNTSSMGGFLPVPGQSVYGASKAAVKLFTEGLRSELLDTRVKVTLIFPGAIATEIAQNSGVAGTLKMDEAAMKNSSIKMLSAQKAAELIIEGMEKNAYRVLVGSDAKFMDKLYRLSPKFAAELIFKKMRSLLR